MSSKGAVAVAAERVCERTSVHFVACLSRNVETRVERVFGMHVRSSYAVLMQLSQAGTTDSPPLLVLRKGTVCRQHC